MYCRRLYVSVGAARNLGGGVCVTPVIELIELLKKLQITRFHLVQPISFGEKHLSFGGFHSVELQITRRTSVDQGGLDRQLQLNT